MSERLFDGAPGRTVLRLVILCVVVGMGLSFIGLSPVAFWRGVWRAVTGFVSTLGSTTTEVLTRLGSYLLLGAAVVLPIWLLSRLFGRRR